MSSLTIIRLGPQHATQIKPLFFKSRHMGFTVRATMPEDDAQIFQQDQYEGFCDAYLSGLSHYLAFGSLVGDRITSIIGFYQSIDEPSWYFTQVRARVARHVPQVLDQVLAYNEGQGRFRFFSMFNARYVRAYRRFALSPRARARYDSYDDVMVPAKTKCFYQNFWTILFNRTLLPVDTLVRCSYLKPVHRIHTANGGDL